MLKDIKLGFKLLKYGYKLKLNVIMLVFFAIFGIASEIFSKGTSIIGGVYFMMSGMFTFQLIMSMDVSELIQSTSLKKAADIHSGACQHSDKPDYIYNFCGGKSCSDTDGSGR